jgi:hypothetical protein
MSGQVGEALSDQRKLLLRAQFEVTASARSLTAVDDAALQMEALLRALQQRIAAEEARTRVTDPNNPAYPPTAAASRARVSKLTQSLSALEEQRLLARRRHAGALATLAGLEQQQQQLLRLPDDIKGVGPKDERRRSQRVRTYERRAAMVPAPSNDNLAVAAAQVPAE